MLKRCFSFRQGPALLLATGLLVSAGGCSPKTGQDRPVDVLIKALKHEDAKERWMAAEHLRLKYPTPTEAIPHLIEALNDSDAKVRQYASEALGWWGTDTLPALVEATKSKDARVREGAFKAMGNLGIAAEKHLPEYIAALKGDESVVVRQAVATALNIIAGRHQKVLYPVFIETITNDKDKRVRCSLIQALGTFRDKEGQDAIPFLTKLKDDSDNEVRTAATNALVDISGVDDRGDAKPGPPKGGPQRPPGTPK